MPFWSGIVLLSILLGFVVLPTLQLGFVADDFFLLVPDQKLPLAQSEDQLHRPLRNAILKTAGRQLGIQNVLPYRLLVAGTFFAVLALLFQLTRRLGAHRMGALAAVFTLAFFPRNQEVLYWFAAWQDLAAAMSVLSACLFFLDFRESGSPYSLGVAAVAYLVALGFKETTVVLPLLLVAIDFYRERSVSSFLGRPFWKAYIPFACVLVAYVVYFFSQSGVASLMGHKTGGYYGFHGFAGVFAGVARALMNIGLPYSLPLGFKDIHSWHVIVLLSESVGALLLAWTLRLGAALMLTVSWLLCTILPTATFAAASNADRYLFIPMLSVAVFVGLLVHGSMTLVKSKQYAFLATSAMAIYTSVGIFHLVVSRDLWQKAGEEVTTVIRETVGLCSKLPLDSEVDIINVTHSLRPRGAVFANGLSEALHANGLSSSLRIVRNFATSDSEQRKLAADVLRCAAAPPGAAKNRTILLEFGGQIHLLDTGCVSTLVDSDRVKRPNAWDILSSGQ